MTYFLIFIISLIKVADSTLAKHFQKNINMTVDFLIAFNIYNSIIACIYFFSADKFKIGINSVTLIFSALYALAVGFNHLLTFLAYSKTSVSFMSIVSTAGSIVVSTLFGLFFLDEKASFRVFSALILLILAVAIPAFNLIKNKSQKNSLLILTSFFFVNGALIIITKLYSVTDGVASSNSFFGLTNVILLSVALILFFIKTRGLKKEKKRILTSFSFKQLTNIGTRNIICNISAIISVAVLKNTDIGIYSIITYSMVLIISLLVSKFYFKEHIKLQNVLSVILAVLAIIINPT